MRDFEQDRKICEAAYFGPWEVRYGEEYQGDEQPPVWNGEIHVYAKDTALWIGMLGSEGSGIENAEFVAAAREGWPAALDEIESLKRQMQEAAIFAASQPHCPDGKECDGYSTSEQSCTACWLEYWRQKSGRFQNGNNHGTTSKMETVGDGEK